MSDGCWVWVPDGWRVVPERWTEGMFAVLPGDTDCRAVSQADIDAAIAAAPKPPSGWQLVEDHMEIKEQGLCFSNTSSVVMPYFIGYPDNDDWYAPLPPGPEEDKP